MTVQGPVKKQQPDGMSHRGAWGGKGGSAPAHATAVPPAPDRPRRPPFRSEAALKALVDGEAIGLIFSAMKTHCDNPQVLVAGCKALVFKGLKYQYNGMRRGRGGAC